MFIFGVVCGQRRVLSGVLLELHDVDVCTIMGGVDGSMCSSNKVGRCLFVLAYGPNVGGRRWREMSINDYKFVGRRRVERRNKRVP